MNRSLIILLGALALGDLKPLKVDEWLRGRWERGLGDRTIDFAHSVLRPAVRRRMGDPGSQPRRRAGAEQESAAKVEKLFGSHQKVVRPATRKAS